MRREGEGLKREEKEGGKREREKNQIGDYDVEELAEQCRVFTFRGIVLVLPQGPRIVLGSSLISRIPALKSLGRLPLSSATFRLHLGGASASQQSGFIRVVPCSLPSCFTLPYNNHTIIQGPQALAG